MILLQLVWRSWTSYSILFLVVFLLDTLSARQSDCIILGSRMEGRTGILEQLMVFKIKIRYLKQRSACARDIRVPHQAVNPSIRQPVVVCGEVQVETVVVNAGEETPWICAFDQRLDPATAPQILNLLAKQGASKVRPTRCPPDAGQRLDGRFGGCGVADGARSTLTKSFRSRLGGNGCAETLG